MKLHFILSKAFTDRYVLTHTDMLIDFRQLFPRWNITPKGVLHVGANIGEEAPVYNELGIKKVIWIEANVDLFPKLMENITKFSNPVAYNFAAGEENKKVTLHISNNAGQSSSVLELGTHKQAHPEVHYIADKEVDMYRIDHVFGSGEIDGCDFLNIDVQGFELSVLRGMGSLLRQFQWVYLEVNQAELYKECALIDSVDLFMTANGFRRVETKWCGNTGWGDACFIR